MQNWSFEFLLGQNGTLNMLIKRYQHRSQGIKYRCLGFGIKLYDTQLSVKDSVPTVEIPKGMIFSVDTEDQWKHSVDKVVN